MNDGDELRPGDGIRSDVRAIIGAQRPPPGSAPGTLVPDPDAPHPVIRILAYGPDRMVERRIDHVDEIDSLIGTYPITWVNVDGLGDIATIERIAEKFSVHRLALEDVVSSHQRPKVEDYEEHTFIVIRMPHPTGERFDSEQLSIFLGDGYVLTFQESEGDCFDPVRDRLRARRGQLRVLGGDYLTYALVDAVIDSYFPVLEEKGEEVETLEDELTEHADPALIGRIHALKRDLLALRRVVWPQREVVNALIRDRSPRISDATAIYLRDCYDHAITLLDVVETYRDIASGLHDLYLSSVSTRLNEIMKVLTIIATIFIPLSFIASLYGMNFDPNTSPYNMPELHWRWGYVYALVLMAVIAAALVFYFWREGWIWARRRRR